MRTTTALLLASCTLAAQPPLPRIQVEPTENASVIFIRNPHSQPLTAFLLELVDYPGSRWAHWQDDAAAEPLAPGAERRLPIASMLVGAAPDYVKVQAALYADGASAGLPDKVAQLVARRKVTLETTRDLVRRLEQAQASGTSVSALLAGLNGLLDSSAHESARAVISDTIRRARETSPEAALAALRKAAQALTSSQPKL
jgi:hypothetical protein